MHVCIQHVCMYNMNELGLLVSNLIRDGEVFTKYLFRHLVYENNSV
jgi:hypothetical protein